MDTVNVLVTGIGAPGAPGIIKCLRHVSERKIRIVGVDMSENASGRRLVDAFYTVPAAKANNFLKAITEVCKTENVKVVIPLVTKELWAFSKNIAMFETLGIKVSVMNYDTLCIVNNKVRLLSKMKELGMETPEFIPCHSVDDVEKACAAIGYPEKGFCIKAAEGNGSRGIRLIDNKKSKYDLFFNEKPTSMYTSYNDMLLALKERDIPEMMVMELLPGEEYGVDALCDNGKILAMAGRSNYPVNSSIPQGCIIENREVPFKIASQLIELLQISGNVNFDFKYDKDGNPRLMEINPRLSATIVSYCPAGINFPYMQIKRLLGEEIEPVEAKEGIRMQRRYNEVFFDLDDKELTW